MRPRAGAFLWGWPDMHAGVLGAERYSCCLSLDMRKRASVVCWMTAAVLTRL